MTHFDRFLGAALVTGIWTLIGSQVISDNQAGAQESPAAEQVQDAHTVLPASRVINATEVVGLTAVVSQTNSLSSDEYPDIMDALRFCEQDRKAQSPQHKKKSRANFFVH